MTNLITDSVIEDIIQEVHQLTIYLRNPFSLLEVKFLKQFDSLKNNNQTLPAAFIHGAIIDYFILQEKEAQLLIY